MTATTVNAPSTTRNLIKRASLSRNRRWALVAS
jgi:hypothetical protein